MRVAVFDELLSCRSACDRETGTGRSMGSRARFGSLIAFERVNMEQMNVRLPVVS